MIVQSTYFGALDISEDKIITFSAAIPGFDSGVKYFVIHENQSDTPSPTADDERLFCWLHSVENEDLAFALLDVFKVKPDYKPEINEEYLNMLSYEEGDNLAVHNIVNVPETLQDMTVNLVAPIVINFTKMKGMQVVLESGSYELKHRIFEELQGASKKRDGVTG
jgi:flagellar assembly factor FliW